MKYSNPMPIILKQIYLSHRWDLNKSTKARSNCNEETTDLIKVRNFKELDT